MKKKENDMNLIAIDIGNTSIKAYIENANGHFQYKSDNIDVLLNEISPFRDQDYSIIISNVRNDIKLENTFNNAKHLLYLNHATSLPVRILYQSVQTLGVDRIAAAVGAYSIFKNSPCLIIDAGTAITIDILNANGEYLGGAISPGIDIRFKALHQFTGKLPLLKRNDEINYPGKTTEESIQTGVILGIINEIEKYINDFLEKYPKGKTIITGGDSLYLVKFIKKTIFAEPNLVVKGLINILKYNAL